MDWFETNYLVDCGETDVYGASFLNKERSKVYTRCVGEKDVKRIIYHEPKGEGDKHYCDVFFTIGEAPNEKHYITRVFDPVSVTRKIESD